MILVLRNVHLHDAKEKPTFISFRSLSISFLHLSISFSSSMNLKGQGIHVKIENTAHKNIWIDENITDKRISYRKHK